MGPHRKPLVLRYLSSPLGPHRTLLAKDGCTKANGGECQMGSGEPLDADTGNDISLSDSNDPRCELVDGRLMLILVKGLRVSSRTLDVDHYRAALSSN